MRECFICVRVTRRYAAISSDLGRQKQASLRPKNSFLFLVAALHVLIAVTADKKLARPPRKVVPKLLECHRARQRVMALGVTTSTYISHSRTHTPARTDGCELFDADMDADRIMGAWFA